MKITESRHIHNGSHINDKKVISTTWDKSKAAVLRDVKTRHPNNDIYLFNANDLWTARILEK